MKIKRLKISKKVERLEEGLNKEIQRLRDQLSPLEKRTQFIQHIKENLKRFHDIQSLDDCNRTICNNYDDHRINKSEANNSTKIMYCVASDFIDVSNGDLTPEENENALSELARKGDPLAEKLLYESDKSGKTVERSIVLDLLFRKMSREWYEGLLNGELPYNNTGFEDDAAYISSEAENPALFINHLFRPHKQPGFRITPAGKNIPIYQIEEAIELAKQYIKEKGVEDFSYLVRNHPEGVNIQINNLNLQYNNVIKTVRIEDNFSYLFTIKFLDHEGKQIAEEFDPFTQPNERK